MTLCTTSEQHAQTLYKYYANVLCLLGHLGRNYCHTNKKAKIIQLTQKSLLRRSYGLCDQNIMSMGPTTVKYIRKETKWFEYVYQLINVCLTRLRDTLQI